MVYATYSLESINVSVNNQFKDFFPTLLYIYFLTNLSILKIDRSHLKIAKIETCTNL